MDQFSQPDTSTDTALLPVADVARQLHTDPYILRQWSRKFSPFLGEKAGGEYPRFSQADVITLSIIQTLLGQGFAEDQVSQHLTLRRNEENRAFPWTEPAQTDAKSVAPRAEHAADHHPAAGRTDLAPHAPLQELFGTISDNQRAILSNQSTVREIVGVVVQDNFNLKDENRKLRDRMLELERVLAEYQRREELRKERLESRLRALETTTSGLQQQIAQLVQIMRKKKRSFFW